MQSSFSLSFNSSRLAISISTTDKVRKAVNSIDIGIVYIHSNTQRDNSRNSVNIINTQKVITINKQLFYRSNNW